MRSGSILLAIPQEWDHIPSNGELFTDTLRNEGYAVLVAFSYADALKIIQSQNLAAVIMIQIGQ